LITVCPGKIITLMDMTPGTVASGLHFLEGPRWHENRIWFSDFHSHQVYSARED